MKFPTLVLLIISLTPAITRAQEPKPASKTSSEQDVDTLKIDTNLVTAIAAELRMQYLLGYYPTNKDDYAAYRKIQVKTSRKDIAIRARPGYRPKNPGR